MRPPENMSAVINRKRYSTETATLLAGDDYWDGHNYERRGRNTFPQVRWNPLDYAIVKAAAGAAGMALCTFIRAAALRELRSEEKAPGRRPPVTPATTVVDSEAGR